MLKLFKRFMRGESGSTGLMLALSIVPLIAGAGVAIDFARYNSAHTQLEAALDAGSLAAAAATNKSTAERIQIGTDIFKANMQSSNVATAPYSVEFSVQSGNVKANGTLKLPTTLMSTVGISSVEVAGKSETKIGYGTKFEIAFVLDYSGSMNSVVGTNRKTYALREAVTKLINAIGPGNEDSVKFALVPFSHLVNLEMPIEYVRRVGGTGTWSGCTVDRLYPLNTMDSSPTNDDGSKWGQAYSPFPWNAGDDCMQLILAHQTIHPLTNDYETLIADMDDMYATGSTFIPLGVEFGYHVLSPNVPFAEGASYSDRGTKKIMILVTDGVSGRPSYGPTGERTVEQSDPNLQLLCHNIKASGIRMITLAFDLDDPNQMGHLRDCATDPTTDFFDARIDSDLAAGFKQITEGITKQVYLSR